MTKNSMLAIVFTLVLLYHSIEASAESSGDDADFTKTCRCLENSTSGYYCAAWTCRTTHDRTKVTCFSGQSTVRTRHRGERPLASVNVGEEVLVSDGNKLIFESIYDFIHAEKTQLYNFLRLFVVNPHRNSSSQIEISSGHLIFIYGKDKAIHASEVKVGQWLQFVDGDQIVPGEVINVERIVSQGFFAPLTRSGTIVISGLVASNYAEIHDHHLAHMAMQPYRLWRRIVGSKQTTDTEMNWYTETLFSIANQIGVLSVC